MIYWAELDENNIVQKVVVSEISNEDPDGYNWLIDNFGGSWIRTYIDGYSGKRFARVGYYYDSQNDVFIPPQPYPSWTLNQDYLWEAPFAKPEGESNSYWNEDSLSWVEING